MVCQCHWHAEGYHSFSHNVCLRREDLRLQYGRVRVLSPPPPVLTPSGINSGPNAGKLALLDFGLVAEIPSEDREAMVSATIHLANRDWDALITDFVSLGFLPADCDRGLITPVMERVLGPYLRGGGAKAFNFSALSQVRAGAALCAWGEGPGGQAGAVENKQVLYL